MQGLVLHPVSQLPQCWQSLHCLMLVYDRTAIRLHFKHTQLLLQWNKGTDQRLRCTELSACCVVRIDVYLGCQKLALWNRLQHPAAGQIGLLPEPRLLEALQMLAQSQTLWMEMKTRRQSPPPALLVSKQALV